MKNKGIFRLLTLLLAVVMCATAFSMTAFASDGSEDYETNTSNADLPIEGVADGNFHVSDDIMDTILALLGSLGNSSEDENEPKQTGIVTTDGGKLNVRTGAGLENKAFTQLENGETVDVLGTDGEWVMILLPERIGYVHSDYLTVEDKPVSTEPSFSLDPDMLKSLLELFGKLFESDKPTGGNNNALTPDGNMNLIDDIGNTEKSGKQFITVETKNGNVFYIIIDRDDEGEATVHFLNQVDEADLMALMKDGETETEPVKCICSDKCSIGAINTDCPVCLLKISECTGVKPEPVKPTEPTDPEPSDTDKDEKKGGNTGMIVFVLVVLAGGGGAALYFFILKPKKGKSKKIPSDIDDFDLDDEEEYIIDSENEES